MSTALRPILLATDDPNDVFAFWRYHKQCGIRNPLEVFTDGEDIIRHLASTGPALPPALLVLSLRMPRMGGRQVLEHLQTTRQNGFPTALLVSPHDYDVPVAVAAYHLGAESFLIRPIEQKEFCTLMSQFQTLTMTGCPETHTDSGPRPSC